VELAADRGLDAPGETARVGDVAPATVKRSVHLRIFRLPELASRLARAVAVLGDRAELREAAALAAVDTAVAAEAADALAAVSILEPGRPLRFVHPLVRNAIYADLPAAAKAAAHSRAAKLLQDRRAEPERIAIHLLATHPDADPEVVATLDAAARRALGRDRRLRRHGSGLLERLDVDDDLHLVGDDRVAASEHGVELHRERLA
jgi:hypothetical protein